MCILAGDRLYRPCESPLQMIRLPIVCNNPLLYGDKDYMTWDIFLYFWCTGRYGGLTVQHNLSFWEGINGCRYLRLSCDYNNRGFSSSFFHWLSFYFSVPFALVCPELHPTYTTLQFYVHYLWTINITISLCFIVDYYNTICNQYCVVKAFNVSPYSHSFDYIISFAMTMTFVNNRLKNEN